MATSKLRAIGSARGLVGACDRRWNRLNGDTGHPFDNVPGF